MKLVSITENKDKLVNKEIKEIPSPYHIQPHLVCCQNQPYPSKSPSLNSDLVLHNLD